MSLLTLDGKPLVLKDSSGGGGGKADRIQSNIS